MLYSYPLSLAFPISIAIWAAIKIENVQLLPQDVRFLGSRVWPSNLRNQLLLVLACSLSFANLYVSCLIRRQSGVIVNKLHSEDDSDLLIQDPYIWTLSLLEALSYFEQLVQLRLSQFWEKRICGEVFEHLIDLSADFHTRNSSDQRFDYVQQGKGLVRLIQMGLFTLLPSAVSLLLNAFFLSRTVGKAPAIGITVFGLLHMYTLSKSEEWTSGLSDKMRQTKQSHRHFIHQRIEHWYLVLCFNRNKDEKLRFYETRDEENKADRRYSDRALTFFGVQDAFLFLVKRAAIAITIHRISQGAVDIGSLVVLLESWTDIFQPITTISNQIHQLGLMRSTARDISDLLCERPSIADSGDKALQVTGGHVVFENVSFSYSSDAPVLTDITLTAEAGQTTAIVGETGSGKSTMLNLLLRLYDVEKGFITIDGQHLKGVSLDSLRDVIGVVSQETRLFNGTIEENLKYGRPQTTDSEMHDACESAAIHKVIGRFPDGYSTKVGDGGRQLSGGEARRIAIARAIIKKPRIFLLDEPTSSVDLETESHIQESLRKACAGRTTFIVAHRLSTIKDADEILVLDKGQILERGSHENLLELDGKYCAMWKKHIGSS